MRLLTAVACLLAAAPARAAVTEFHYPGQGGEVPATLVTPAKRAGRAPAAIFVHWGQGDRRQFLGEAVFLSRLGVISLLVDAPWNRPDAERFDGMRYADVVLHTVGDVERGIDLLVRRTDVDAKRIAFVGHSFGGHVGAVLAARERRLAAFVFVGGPANVSQMMRTSALPFFVEQRKQPGFEAAMRALEAIEPERVLGQKVAPLFVQVARYDEFVPMEESERLVAAAPEPKVWRVYDCDHAFDDRARDDRIAWLLLRFGLPAAPSPNPPRVAAPEAPIADAPALFEMRIAAERPGMSDVTVRRDLAYSGDQRLDVYLPPRGKKPPVVVLLDGQGVRRFKDGGPMTSRARYLASRGVAVVVPDLAGEATSLDAAIAHVARNADSLGVDAGNLCLVVFADIAAGHARPGVRCVVAWNTFVADPKLGPDSPPLLVVRSQRDRPELNASVDKLVAAAKGAGAKVTVVDIPGGHHAADVYDDSADTRAALHRVLQFLADNL